MNWSALIIFMCLYISWFIQLGAGILSQDGHGTKTSSCLWYLTKQLLKDLTDTATHLLVSRHSNIYSVKDEDKL